MSWFKRLLGIEAVTSNCVPKAMANAMTWAINHKVPVWVCDVKGHHQAASYTDTGEIEFLQGNGWDVWPGKKEGTNPIYKMRTLQNAMEHFIKANPHSMPTPEEQAKLDQKIKDTFGTDPKDVE